MAKTSDEYEMVYSADDKGMSTATSRVTSKLKELGESQNKVKKHMLGFMEDMTRATSSTDMLASGVLHVSEAMKLGLAGGVLAGGVMKLHESAQKTTAEMNALATSVEDMDKAANTADYSKPVERLKQEAEVAKKVASEAAQKRREITGGEFNMHLIRGAVQNFKEGLLMGEGSGDWRENTYRGVPDMLRGQEDRANENAARLDKEIMRREEMQKREEQMRQEQAKGPASLYKTLGAESERLKMLKEELALSKAAIPRNDAAIEASKTAVAMQDQKVTALNAESELLDHTLKIEERKKDIRLSSASQTEKAYELAKKTAELAEAEARAMKDKNSDQAQFLQLKAQEAGAVTSQMDEALNKGKTGKETRARFRAQDKERSESEKFRARREADEGLIPTKRGLGGEVIEGRDPVTGRKEGVKHEAFDRQWDLDKEKNRKWELDKKKGEEPGVTRAARGKKHEAQEAQQEKADKKDANKGVEKAVGEGNKKLEEIKSELKNMVAKP